MNIPRDMRDLGVFLILLTAIATCAESLRYAEAVSVLEMRDREVEEALGDAIGTWMTAPGAITAAATYAIFSPQEARADQCWITLLYSMVLFTLAGMATRGAECWHWLLVSGLGVALAITTYTRIGDISYAAAASMVFIGPTMFVGWMKLVRAGRADAAV